MKPTQATTVAIAICVALAAGYWIMSSRGTGSDSRAPGPTNEVVARDEGGQRLISETSRPAGGPAEEGPAGREAQAPASRQSSDPLVAWQQLPKNQASIYYLFASFRDDELAPGDVLRNSQLNPRDRELSGEDRARCGALLKSLSKRIKEMRKAASKTPSQEMSDLSASGKVTRVYPRFTKEQRKRLQDEAKMVLASLGKNPDASRVRRLRHQIDHPEKYAHSLAMDDLLAQGKRPIVYGTSEAMYIADVDSLPGETMRRGGEDYVLHEFTRTCSTWFLKVGALTAAEATELQALTLAQAKAAHWAKLINRSR